MNISHPGKSVQTSEGVLPRGAYVSHAARLCLICEHRFVATVLTEYLSRRSLVVERCIPNEEELAAGLTDSGEFPFEAVLLALVGPIGTALGRIRTIVEMLGSVPLVVLTEQVHRGEVYTILRTGAKAVVSIDGESEELLRGIESACRDRIFLSADVAELVVSDLAHVPPSSAVAVSQNAHLSGRETEIVRLLWDGLSTKEIARRLHVSFKTVENHRYNIYQKCGASGLAALFRYAVRNAIVAV